MNPRDRRALLARLAGAEAPYRSDAAWRLRVVEGDAEVDARLEAALRHDPDARVRRRVAKVLGQRRRDVRAALADTDARVRCNAARWTLVPGSGRYDWNGVIDPVVIPALAEVVARCPEAAVRDEAVRLLGLTRDRRAAPALGAALEDSDGGVRHGAAIALGRCGDRDAVLPLGRALAAEPADHVRRSILDAVARLGGPLAVDILLEALRDPAASWVAAEGLGRTGHLAGN